ncbi:unnamed protein product [Urochloa humidicola]
MARKKDRRRRRTAMRKCSRAGQTSSTRGSRTMIHDLPHDLLELVLRRIRSHVCLVRAAAVCKLWRRVLAGALADNDFLRRLDRPPRVLGHYYEGSSNSSRRMPAGIRLNSLDGHRRPLFRHFLAGHYSGTMALSDGHRRLLAFVRSKNSSFSIVVCNPLTREHRQLICPRRHGYRCRCTIGAFLLDGSFNMSYFRVLCVWLDRDYDSGTNTAHAAVFSTRIGRWVLKGSADVSNIMPTMPCWFDAHKFLGRAGGSLCWSGEVGDAVLHLSETSGVFSTIGLPGGAIIGSSRRPMPYHRGNLRSSKAPAAPCALPASSATMSRFSGGRAISIVCRSWLRGKCACHGWLDCWN